MSKTPLHKLLTDDVISYLNTALWTSTDNCRDDGGDPLDDNYTVRDFSAEAIESAAKDLAAFIEANRADIDASGTDLETVAHDFWLTRNRHGVGFWDGDYEKTIGERLTKSSHTFGEVDAYVGDNGKIYFSR